MHKEFATVFEKLFPNDSGYGSSGLLITKLARSIEITGAQSDSGKPTLLVLVDEYDKPLRDIFSVSLVQKRRMRVVFSRRPTPIMSLFFDSLKSIASLDIHVKRWLTGITPVGLSLISGFRYTDSFMLLLCSTANSRGTASVPL